MPKLLAALGVHWLALPGIALTALAMCYGIVAWLSVRLRPAEAARSPRIRPPVTILKPLCGAEQHLYDCLRSFCDQDYPRFQIVFGVSDPSDPALGIVRRLQKEFPGLDLDVAIDPRQRGSNRKVNNLINMMPLARYDYLVIADSDVCVERNYLNAVVTPLLDPRVGVVTCPYAGRPQPGPWSRLGSLFVNDWFMPSAHVAARFGSRAFAFGATIALHREVLARAGGFAAIADQLADDYRLGELTRQLGLRTVLSEAVIDTCIDEPSLTDLVSHELRWLRTIRSVRPAGYSFAFLSFSLPVALLGCIMAGGPPPALAMLAVTFGARLKLHSATHEAPQSRAPLWALLVNDFLAFALWGLAFFTRRVQWRHMSYRVARGGALEPIPPQPESLTATDPIH